MGRTMPEGRMAYIWNHPVEGRSLVTKPMPTGCKLAKVLGSLWDSFIIKFENNPSGRLRIDGNVKLHGIQSSSDSRVVHVDSRRRCAYYSGEQVRTD